MLVTDLSVDPHLGESAYVQGVVIVASEDGRYVYFVANRKVGAISSSSGKAR